MSATAAIRDAFLFPRLRLSTLLKGIIFALSGPLLAFCLVSGAQSFSIRQVAEAIYFDNQTSDLLMEAAGHWALERGLTNAALNAPVPVQPETLRKIGDRRRLGDDSFARAMERVRGGRDFLGREKRVADAVSAQAALKDLRGRVEADLVRERSDRDPAVLSVWVPTATRLIEASRAIRVSLASHDTDSMRTLAFLTEIKDFAWVMSEFAGRERAMVAARMADGQALSPQDMYRLAEFRGRVELAWGKIQAAREMEQVPPKVAEFIKAVEGEFFGTFQPVRKHIYAGGTMAAPEWIAASTAAIDTVLALGAEVGRHTAEVASSTRVEKTWQLILMTALGGTVVALVWASFAVSSRRIIRPLGQLVEGMTAMARGNLGVRFEVRHQDEIGDLVAAAEVFRRNALDKQAMEGRERAEIATREERTRMVATATARFDATISSMVSKIKGAVEHLHGSADTLSANAEQTQRQSSAVASATDQATANVETVSAAGTELMASIQEISRQVQQSAMVAHTAAHEAEETNHKIGGLADAASKIGEIVSMISGIASQTNLLALNATIESARAGETGKGFAVVAHEVKNLAGQTSKATDDITAQIASVQAETQASVKAIEAISLTIGRINEMATAIAGAVEEQGAATAEIARNIDQASAGTREVASNIAGVAQAAAETGKMAQAVFRAANELLDESRTLEQEVERFLGEVRERSA